MKRPSSAAPDPIARGKWNGLVKAFALLGVAVFVFFIARDPTPPVADASFSEIGRWSEVSGRGEIEWTAEGRERLFTGGEKVDDRAYRVLRISGGILVLERDYSPEELAAHPEWEGRGRVEYRILGPDRLRREFAPEAGVDAMEFARSRP